MTESKSARRRRQQRAAAQRRALAGVPGPGPGAGPGRPAAASAGTPGRCRGPIDVVVTNRAKPHREVWPWRGVLTLTVFAAVLNLLLNVGDFLVSPHARSFSDVAQFAFYTNPLFIIVACLVGMPLIRRRLAMPRGMSIIETSFVGVSMVVISTMFYAAVVSLSGGIDTTKELVGGVLVSRFHLTSAQFVEFALANILTCVAAAAAYRGVAGGLFRLAARMARSRSKRRVRVP